MSFDRFDPGAWLANFRKPVATPATPATVATAEKDAASTVAIVAGVAAQAPQELKIQPPALRLSAPLEAILARFPGAEVVRLTRYDVPDHSQLEPLAPAGHVLGICAQCRDQDGMARRWLDRRRNVVVWLHLECRRHYWLTGETP
jgi:hypothetical protein